MEEGVACKPSINSVEPIHPPGEKLRQSLGIGRPLTPDSGRSSQRSAQAVIVQSSSVVGLDLTTEKSSGP